VIFAEFMAVACLCGTAFWFFPGIIGGLAVVAGLYFGKSRLQIKSLISIWVGWVISATIAGAFGLVVRFVVGEIVYKVVGHVYSGSFVSMLPELVGFLITGLLMGSIGAYFTVSKLESVSYQAIETDAA